MTEHEKTLLEKLKAIAEADSGGTNAELVSFLAKTGDLIGVHSIRVSGYAVMVAKEMGLPEKLISGLQLSSLLHDIGKILIPHSIIYKTDSLTGEETSVMQQHPLYGNNIIKRIATYHQYADIILYHHEYFNGNGYPHGLSGTDIPLLSRIISVADAYEAMTSDRPYRKGFSHREAVTRLKMGRNNQFDPEIIASFLKSIRSLAGYNAIEKGTVFEL